MARKSIKELPHLWRVTITGDCIEIDTPDNKWKPTDKMIPTTFCKILHYSDGTQYIRFRGDSWTIESKEETEKHLRERRIKMFGNRINYEKHGWKLTEDAHIEYRSHYNAWQCECPNNWLSAMAENDKGETAKIWWYWPDNRHDLDGGDWVKDWSKCNDIQVVED